MCGRLETLWLSGNPLQWQAEEGRHFLMHFLHCFPQVVSVKLPKQNEDDLICQRTVVSEQSKTHHQMEPRAVPQVESGLGPHLGRDLPECRSGESWGTQWGLWGWLIH